MTLPAIEIDPMTAPATLNPASAGFESDERSTTPAIAAAAPPPIPLKTATIWGLAVMLTTRAQYQQIPPPTMTPTAISSKLEIPGLKNVATTAASIAAPA